MFKDLVINHNIPASFAGTQMGNLQLNSAVFDQEHYDYFITEANNRIEGLIESYRSLMTRALTESAGVINEDAQLIIEQANEHVGTKIKKWLDRFIEFVKQAFESSINFVRNLFVSNKTFMEKVRPAVEKKDLTAEDKRNIKVITRHYNPEVIKVGNSEESLKYLEQIASLNITDDIVEKVKDKMKDLKDLTADQLRIHYAKKLVTASISETDDWGKFKAALRKELVGDQKITMTFTGNEFSRIDDLNKNIAEIEKSLVGLSAKFRNVLNKIQVKVKQVTAAATKDEEKSEDIRFFNILRLHLSAVFDAVNTLKQLKLQVLKSELHDLRVLCLAAYRYKPNKVLNDSVVEPVDPLFESGEVTDEDTDDADTVTESAYFEPSYQF